MNQGPTLDIDVKVDFKPELLLDHPRAIVWHADWRDVVNYPDQADPVVDVTITDPPYTAHVHANIRSCTTNGTLKVRPWEPGFEPLTGFDHVPHLLKLSRRWVLCFSALETFGEYLESAGGYWKQNGCYVRSGIWRKKQAAPQLSGDRPANSCEGIAIMHHRPHVGRLQWNGRGKHAYWAVEGDAESFVGEGNIGVPDHFDFGRDRAQKRHPAQKPKQLCDELVKLFSKPGEVVFDPYAGSGAIGAAAIEADRKVILIDADRQWAEHCAERMAAFVT